jgi:hypothetical protein
MNGANNVRPDVTGSSGTGLIVSLAGEKPAQGFLVVGRLAVPGDVGDPPPLLELDQVEDHGRRLVHVRERDSRARLVGGDIAHRDIDGVDLPILRIDEGIALERSDLAPLVGVLAVLDGRFTAASVSSGMPLPFLPLYVA